MICKPIEGASIFSSKGYELQDLRLTVLLYNVANPNEVAYTTKLKSSYKGINEKALAVSVTLESKRDGTLKIQLLI